jgi:hypothetical protein
MMMMGYVGIAVAQTGTNTAVLQWDANTESDLAGYKLYRGNLPCPNEGPRQLLVTVGKVTTYTDTTIPITWLDACYWLIAFDTSANPSPFSIPAGKKFALPLPAPVTFTQDKGTFTWSLVPGATGYLLRVHKAGTPYEPCSGMTFCNEVFTLTTTSQIVVLEPNTKYDAWVGGHDSTGRPGETSGTSFTTPVPDVTPPVEPGGLKVTKSTPEEVIVVASRKDCARVVTSTTGSTKATHERHMTCVK